MRRLAGFTKAVRAAAFLPDGRLVAGGDDKWVRVFDGVSGECVAAVKHKQVVYAVAAAPDGKAVAYAGRYGPDDAGENVVRTLAPDDGKPGITYSRSFGRWPSSIWSLAYSPDGEYFAAARRQLGGGNMPNGGGGHWWRCRAPFESGGLADPGVSGLAFGPVGCELATASKEAVRLFATPASDESVVIPLKSAMPATVAFVSPSNPAVAAGASIYVATGGINLATGTRKHIRIRVGASAPSGLAASHALAALAASPDGRTLLAAGRSGVVEAYDAQTRALRSRHDFGVGSVHGLAFAPDGLTFAVAGEGGLAVCDAE